jgi:hypothetical protein
MIICTDTPILPDLAPGRWRVSMQLSDAKVGQVQLLTGGRALLDVSIHEFASDHIITSVRRGPVVLVVIPRIPGRRAPNITLTLTEEL